MRILILTQVLPYPPDSGGKIRAYYVIRYLAQNHQVTLASLTRSEEDQTLCSHLTPYCDRVETVLLRRSRMRDAGALVRSLCGDLPFVVQRDQITSMGALVQRLVAEVQPHVVHAIQLNMAPYVRSITGITKILDQENAVSTILERVYRTARPGPTKLLAYLEWRKLAWYEGQACAQFDRVLAVSPDDRKALERLSGGRADITVVPIGIDCEEIRPIPRTPGAKAILSVGTMHWPPNADGALWFANEVLPLIRRQVPEARFFVAGKNPPKAVLRLQKLGWPRQSGDHPVVVLGYVDDLAPYFAGSAVFVVPLRVAGGIRVKILDAWARGIPIVSTRVGCEGIEVRGGENMLIADTPEDFARAVVQVTQDEQLGRHLAENGRRWVEQKYDWRVVYRAYDYVYDSLVRRGQPARGTQTRTRSASA